MSEKKLSEHFEEELAEIEQSEIFDAAYRRKKLIIYGVRTFIAILLYGSFWEHEWVRWTLLFYIPLNLFGLLSIFIPNLFLRKKIERTRKKIQEAEDLAKRIEDEEASN